MQKQKLNIILAHLFKKQEQRELVKLVYEGRVATVYQAERLTGIPVNTGTRLTRKFERHMEYLESLGLKL